MTKQETFNEINVLLNKIPLETRRKFKGVCFVVEDGVIKLDKDGYFAVAECSPGLITFYSEFNDREHFKKVFIHEVAHHLGLNEERVRTLIDNKY